MPSSKIKSAGVMRFMEGYPRASRIGGRSRYDDRDDALQNGLSEAVAAAGAFVPVAALLERFAFVVFFDGGRRVALRLVCLDFRQAEAGRCRPCA